MPWSLEEPKLPGAKSNYPVRNPGSQQPHLSPTIKSPQPESQACKEGSLYLEMVPTFSHSASQPDFPDILEQQEKQAIPTVPCLNSKESRSIIKGLLYATNLGVACYSTIDNGNRGGIYCLFELTNKQKVNKAKHRVSIISLSWSFIRSEKKKCLTPNGLLHKICLIPPTYHHLRDA